MSDTLRDIICRFGPGYLQRHGANMLASHRRALQDAMSCRTEAMGGHLEVCDDCGCSRFAPHSCRNRLCPACHTAEIADWTAKRALEILPVNYFRLTFTVPSELRRLVRSHQNDLGNALIKAAAEAITTVTTELSVWQPVRLHRTSSCGAICSMHLHAAFTAYATTVCSPPAPDPHCGKFSWPCNPAWQH